MNPFRQFRSLFRKRRRKAKPRSKTRKRTPKQKQRHAPTGNHSDFYYLYILKLNNGGFYVGITNNFKRRYAEHATGRGAKVTRTYHPVGVVSVRPLGKMTYAAAEKFEDDQTLALMEQYGYSRVRGGHWSQVNDKAVYTALTKHKQQIYNRFHRNVDLMVSRR